MQKVLLFIISIVTFSYPSTQNIDEERMNRDIEVAENVLSTLLHKTKGATYLQGFRNEQVDGSYLEDYGVIFTVKDWGFGYSFAPALAWGGKDPNEKSGGTSVGPNLLEADESDESRKEDFINGAKTFLVDYGSLISQLEDGHHIMIKLASDNGPFVFRFNNENAGSGTNIFSKKSSKPKKITLEISVKDLKAVASGSLSRDGGLKRVIVTEVDSDDEQYPDLELLSTMFQRLYQQDLSGTYYCTSSISYEKLKNLGAIFKMKLYSSTENANSFFMPTISYNAEGVEERNKKVMELLPQFEKDFRENLVNYGRTVKNLGPDEMILFDVQMTQCKGCSGFPATMKFSVKKSVLDDFNKGNLTMAQAVAKVEVEKKV